MSDTVETVEPGSESAGSAAAGPPADEWDPVMRSPLSRRHAELGAEFVRDGAWEVAASYGDAPAEARALAEGVGVCDITARGTIDLRGDLTPVLPRLARTSEGVEPGEIVPLEPAPSEAHPGLVARVSDEWALVYCVPTSLEGTLERLAEPAEGGTVMVTDVSSHYAGFAFAGPGAADLLARITPFDVTALAPGACASTRAMDVGAIILRRDLGPDRADVVEVWVGSELGRFAWETIMAAGRRLGVAPVGRDTLVAVGWW